ncbi:hypothetical protein JX265_004480 [Neoarthrinium moseri]|uniref:Rhodopsin domain-containing protein n=1 Tax=Neoarthrinium moseri TaxID=1658444 RepID=A0A9P9WR40_9PEZI|nr:uncharacterized protein JN550_010849 [Neoarthrinium moseri]KAI1850769.1 hypothetical protein JX266_004051 [Neoarthrinium moseri]KAI1861469.1 hypothetical protein JN550_010849 [Neoarthrinium moseri]KAI1875422.1 hypothetical protein JX265_004480 [Neoarthrinium moseri]
MNLPRAPDPAYAAESNTTWIVTVVTIFHVIALSCVALRVYARAFVIKKPGWDDLMMVLCTLCTIGGWSVFIIQSYHGLGRHQDTISPPDLIIYSQAGLWQSIISAAWALTFLKISIALNLLRIGSNSRWYIWSLWATIILNVMNCISGTFTFLLYCRPLPRYWDKSIPGSCAPIIVMITGGLVNTAVNIFTDIVLATLPVPVIWSLNLNRRKRLSVIGILSLGWVAVTFGIVKSVHQIAYGSVTDKSFKQSVQFWGFLQLQVGIMAACAPSLRPLFGRFLKLSTNDKLNQYNSQSRQYNAGLVTIGGTNDQRRKSIRPQSAEDNQSDISLTIMKGGTTVNVGETFYRHSDTGSGSEERILPHTARGAEYSSGGVLQMEKTTNPQAPPGSAH